MALEHLDICRHTQHGFQLLSWSYSPNRTRLFAIRIIIIGNEGCDHHRTLRRLATGLISETTTFRRPLNSVVEDTIFRLSLEIGALMDEALDDWAQILLEACRH